MTQHLDELWTRFKAVCAERDILPAAPSDWEKASFAWRVLDNEQKGSAIQDVATRDATDWTIERGLPQRYIADKLWQRPQRKAAAPRTRREEMWESA